MNTKLKIALIVVVVLIVSFLVYKFVIKANKKEETSRPLGTGTGTGTGTPVDVAIADVPEKIRKLNSPLPSPSGYKFDGEARNDNGDEVYRYKKVGGFGFIFRPKYS